MINTKLALIKEIIIILILTIMVLVGLVAIFLENFRNPEAAATSFTVTSFIVGKKLGDKYYAIKRKL